jgi:DNA-binding transcriptional LysR family regulator
VVHVDGIFSSNDIGLLKDAAMAGLGIALLPELIIREALESRALVPVLPGAVEAENRIAVVYVEREFMPPQVRAFVDALIAWGPKLQRDPPPMRLSSRSRG